MPVHEYEDFFPSSFDYEPWLIQLHGKKKAEQQFMNPYNRYIEERKIPQLAGKVCLGCFGYWLLLADESTKATFFLHRTLDPKLTVHLPPLRSESFQQLGGCVLSSSPTSRKCVVTFVAKRRDVILYCRPKEDAYWNKVSLPIHLEGHFFNGQVVRSKGEIYALHGGGLSYRVVAINEKSLLMGDCTWRILQMPASIKGRHWRHLVASGEKIFLVSVIICIYRGTPTYYTIHLLETSGSDLSWKRVDSIGGRAFFLGGIHSSSLSAIQAGANRDCIYVLNLKDSLKPGQGIYRICLRDQTVCLSLLLNRRKDKIWDKLCWAMPTRSRKSKHETSSFSPSIGTNKHVTIYVNKEKKKEKFKDDISRPWADMPIELVQLLLRHLSLVDCIRLPSVCKAWNSLSNPTQEVQVYPWLMYPVKDSSSWRLFDPIYGKEYSIDMTWLRFSTDLTFHYSKDGWVLVSKEDNSILLLNPLTRECVSLPNLEIFCRDNPLMFSSAPSSPDCVVFTVLFPDDDESAIEILTWSPGEEKWSKVSLDDYFEFCLLCSPVFSRGEFYCYGLRGEFLVYDPKNKTHRVVEMQAPIKIKLFTGNLMECYLVESKGDLIMVFRGSITDPIRVFKLDKLNMAWRELDDMDDVTIFLDRRTSLAKCCPEKRYRNQIYLPGFTDDYCKSNAFYSLETNKYYPDIYYLLKEPINCIWIEPRVIAR